jgi:uncharacterized membrane protein
MLHRHERVTLGLLLGILLGSVVAIWPFDKASRPAEYIQGAAIALAGFICTVLLAHIRR